MAKECRKFGVSLVVASQEAKDFHASLFAAVVNYLNLVLNVAEADAQILARYLAPPGETARIASELRSLAKFTAYFFSEGRRPSRLRLKDPYQPVARLAEQ
jgi:DNA helicase HerA-like ATPase